LALRDNAIKLRDAVLILCQELAVALFPEAQEYVGAAQTA
jgi:hypothetical protein